MAHSIPLCLGATVILAWLLCNQPAMVITMVPTTTRAGLNPYHDHRHRHQQPPPPRHRYKQAPISAGFLWLLQHQASVWSDKRVRLESCSAVSETAALAAFKATYYIDFDHLYDQLGQRCTTSVKCCQSAMCYETIPGSYVGSCENGTKGGDIFKKVLK